MQSSVDSPAVGTDAGFKQGCVLAPELFNLYLDTAVRALLPVLCSVGVKISYKTDGQLRECKNFTHNELVGIVMYADDICLIADDPDNLRQAIIAMDAVFLMYGLRVSTQETKVLVVNKEAKVHAANLQIYRLHPRGSAGSSR